MRRLSEEEEVFIGQDGQEYCRDQRVADGEAEVRALLRRISVPTEESNSCDIGTEEGRLTSRSYAPEVLREIFDAIVSAEDPNETPSHTEDSIDKEQFMQICRALELGLTEAEVGRVWNQVDTNGDGRIVFEEFERGIQRRKLLRRIVSAYLGSSPDDLLSLASAQSVDALRKHKPKKKKSFVVPESYDYAKSTAENYTVVHPETHEKDLVAWRESIESDSIFSSERKCVDYSYHVLYSEDRRQWQDKVIKSCTDGPESRQTRPWVVWTCGTMGAGKSHALHWLSENGYFPLDNIVHVDPDRFKQLMPEWKGYLKNSRDDVGSLCHKESGYLAEVTQLVAMNQRQHVWVDGSLRDAQYYVSVFKRLKEHYPMYRMAIIYVYASREVAWRRTHTRGKQTGRMIPKCLFEASVAAPAESLRVLTPYVDFLARLRNDVDGQPPVLEAFESVDHSGNFDRIRRRFGESEHEAEFRHFPQQRGARRLRIVPRFEAVVNFLQVSNEIAHSTPFANANGTTRHRLGDYLTISKPQVLVWDWAVRARAAAPDDTTFVAYCQADFTHLQEIQEEESYLAKHSGLAYLDLQQRVLRVVAFSPDPNEQHMIRFLDPISLPSAARAVFRNRWQRLEPDYPAYSFGATASCWLAPLESVLGTRYSASGGELFLFGCQPDDDLYPAQPPPNSSSSSGTCAKNGQQRQQTEQQKEDKKIIDMFIEDQYHRAPSPPAPPRLLFFPIRQSD